MMVREVGASVAFVAAAFLSLSFFIDFVDELQKIGRFGITVWQAAVSALAELPGNLYELLPFAVLIGTIYALARMAQSSEFTILRTGGLSPRRALGLLAGIGAGFSALTFFFGDVVVPFTETQAEMLKADFRGGRKLGSAGAWLKERRGDGPQDHSFTVNVSAIDGRGVLRGVRIFEFDAQGNQLSRTAASEASVGRDAVWTLRDVERTVWPAADPQRADVVLHERFESLRWPSTLDAGVVAAAVLPFKIMATTELWRYSRHLSANEQAAQRYEIQFWKKALYPFACLVMVALALPFAYLHARAGGVSLKVFGGIMLGVSFVLLNNVAGHIGLLRGWTPWLVAALPSALFLLLSMSAFAWLVRYR
jgi:lipopolysaccharide export system permease protein